MNAKPLSQKMQADIKRLFPAKIVVQKAPITGREPSLREIREKALVNELNRIRNIDSEYDENSIFNPIFTFLEPTTSQVIKSNKQDTDDLNSCFTGFFPIGSLPTISEL